MNKRTSRILAGLALATGLTLGVGGTAQAYYYAPVTQTPKAGCQDGGEWYLDGMKVLRSDGKWYLCSDGTWTPTTR